MMLAEDVRLDLLSRRQATGSQKVGEYFANYERTGGWRLAPALLDGREVAAVFLKENDPHPQYFVTLEFSSDRVTLIRDYRHVDYISRELQLALRLV